MALFVAEVRGLREVAEVLLASGAEVTAKNVAVMTPLGVAMFDHQKDTAELLRQHGVHRP